MYDFQKYSSEIKLYFTPKQDPIEELYEFTEPIGKMKDPRETIKFIRWLPELTRDEHCYFGLLLVRAKEKRTQFGFRGKEKALAKIYVPGYHRNPKLRLYLELRRLSLLAEYSNELFIYEQHIPGTNKVGRIWIYPRDILGILVNTTIHDWVRASIKAMKEFLEGVWEQHKGGYSSRLRRLDERVKSLIPTTRADGVKNYLTIDVDERSLVEEVLEEIKEYTGFVPARITTPRGLHILVSWQDIPHDRRRSFKEDFIDKLDKKYNGLVEYKSLPQEPVPGTEYKKPGFIVRFYPEEK